MENGWQQSHRELYYELKIAKDKAGQRFPDRLKDIETVFAVADALRGSLIELDGIATQTAEYGEFSIQQVDGLHTALWNNRELFDSLSDYNRALFTWRETPAEWRGQKASNIVELIRDESLQYGGILQKCSLRNTLAPSKQLREEHPELWFDAEGVTEVAKRIRERISPTISPAEIPASPETDEEYPTEINSDVTSELSEEQRNALQALAVRIETLLRMCPDGSVSKHAREYCCANLLRNEFGTLAYTCDLFRNLNPVTRQRLIQFPGTLAHDAIPYALAIGMSGKFTPPALRKQLFKTDDLDSESLSRLKLILERFYVELREPFLPACNSPLAGWRADLLVDALRAAYRVSKAVKTGNAAECITSLEARLATALWKCLKRLGWWAPDECETPAQRITWWLFRDDTNQVEFADEEEKTRIQTPEDRSSDAVRLIEGLAAQVSTRTDTCLDVYRKIYFWLQRIDRNEYPLSFSFRQRGCPPEYELTLYRWCFDVECLVTTLNSAAEKHGLATIPNRTAEEIFDGNSGHPLVAQKRVKDGIHDALRHHLSEWMKAVHCKGELVSGWEVRNSALPSSPIQNTNELREWLSDWLNSIHEARASQKPWNTPEMFLDDVRRELRNSERLLEELRIPLPTDFTDEPENINRAEKQLKLLIRSLAEPTTQVIGSNDESKKNNQPAANETDKQRQHASCVQAVTTEPASESVIAPDSEPEVFSPPLGTYTVRQFADALTDMTATDSERTAEAIKLKALMQKYWEGKIETRKPRVRAKGIRGVEYFSLHDLFEVAMEQKVIFDRESVTTRLAGTVLG